MQKKGFLWFVYHHPFGVPFLWIFRMSWFSRMMGFLFMTSFSRHLVGPLIRIYNICLDTYRIPEGGFSSVNDFFIRSSREDFRTFPRDLEVLGSPVDGCIQIFQNISFTNNFCIKGYHAHLGQLFGPKISDFIGGDICFCRLRFSDYHRFHFFDDGKILTSESRNGPLYSVDNDVLDTGLWVENKSHSMCLQTKHFGDVLVLEVGATNVGSILQEKNAGDVFLRGEEKGYFQLGGSAVLLVFQKNIIQWETNILEASLQSQEFEVITGEKMGLSKN